MGTTILGWSISVIEFLTQPVGWFCLFGIYIALALVMEYRISRVLVDARILNVFEGAAEIQAGIIARALLER